MTHHEREPLVLGKTTFTFVTDGIESALDQARAAAGDRDVLNGGGAHTELEPLRVVDSPAVTHLAYRVVR